VIHLTDSIEIEQKSSNANHLNIAPFARGDLGGHLTSGYSRLRSTEHVIVVDPEMNSLRDVSGQHGTLDN